jgi:hypothetical protein
MFSNFAFFSLIRRPKAGIVLILPFLLSLAGFPQNKGYSLSEARKVLKAIDRVQQESSRENNGPLRQIALTESEFNAYIAYRIETEKEEIMKELRLKLLDRNRIEGRIHIDLRSQKIPQFLRPEMDLYFAADLEASYGKARLDVKELFLDHQPIQPLFLDLVIRVIAQFDKAAPSSLSDWYELPYGIKNIKTQKGSVIFYY